MASLLHFAGLAVTAQILGHRISKTIPPPNDFKERSTVWGTVVVHIQICGMCQELRHF